MGKIDTVLFDWDGTLAQTLEVWLSTFREAYNTVGIYPSDTEISSRFGNWQAHLELGVKPIDEARYQSILETVYPKLEKVALYDGVQKTLHSLRAKKLKLGLVSTSNSKMLDTALCANKLAGFFDVVISADDTVKHKPDPEPIYLALQQLDSSVDSAIFVGDSDKDTGAASNAAIDLVLFTPESHSIYYDLEYLKQQPSVIRSFKSWNNFPFEALG